MACMDAAVIFVTSYLNTVWTCRSFQAVSPANSLGTRLIHKDLYSELTVDFSTVIHFSYNEYCTGCTFSNLWSTRTMGGIPHLYNFQKLLFSVRDGCLILKALLNESSPCSQALTQLKKWEHKKQEM